MKPLEESKQIFDESYVDCNTCTHYWDDSCNGVPNATERPCTAYKATRQTDIPLQVEKLRMKLIQAHRSIVLINIILILHLLLHLLEDVL